MNPSFDSRSFSLLPGNPYTGIAAPSNCLRYHTRASLSKIRNMADKEIAALSDTHLRSASFVYVAALFAALDGLLFGYDTGVIFGALIFIKREFGLTTVTEEVVLSGVLLGATIGAIVGGKTADVFGRRRVLLMTAAIFAVGALASAATLSPAIDRQSRDSRFGDWSRLNERSGLSIRSCASACARPGCIAFKSKNSTAQRMFVAG